MLKSLAEFLKYQPWDGATLYNVLIALIALFIAFLMRHVVGVLLNRWLMAYAQRTHTKLDVKFLEAVEKPLSLLVLLVGFKITGYILNLPAEPFQIHVLYQKIVDCLLIVGVAWLVLRLVDVLGTFLRQLAERTDSKLDDQLIPLLIKSLKILAGLLAAVTIIQRLGYSIGAILGTLAIGGLAISLAAQDTLKNFFGSVFIFLDRPFHVGDWVTCGEADGTVEEVGFRSTKIRTFKNTLITVPNSRIADSAVENHTRMQKRRIYIQLGVTYSTTALQMETLVKGIKQILIEHPGIRQDFHMVKFTDFADSSLSVMVYCFTRTTVWEEHLTVREEVFLSIMRLVERLGLSIAFPSRSLYIEKWPESGTAGGVGATGAQSGRDA